MSDVRELAATVGRAVLAPSLHNSQPWRFVVADEAVEVWLDARRGLPVADPGFRAARMACGAAVFNLRLAIPVELGRQPDTTVLPEYGRRDLIARLRPGPVRPATPRERELYASIRRRHTNRYPFRDDVPVDRGQRAALRAAAYGEGCWLDMVTDPARRDALAELSRRAERLLAADPAYREELRRWARDNPADGVPPGAAGPRPEPYDPLGQRDYGGPDRHAGREYEREPLLAVLGGPGDSPASQVAAGQALQRILLTAAGHGLAVALYSQPFDIPDVHAQVRALMGRLGTPYLLLRIGYPTRPAPSTPRRPVSQITRILGQRTGSGVSN
jgi:nitroreductase